MQWICLNPWPWWWYARKKGIEGSSYPAGNETHGNKEKNVYYARMLTRVSIRVDSIYFIICPTYYTNHMLVCWHTHTHIHTHKTRKKNRRNNEKWKEKYLISSKAFGKLGIMGYIYTYERLYMHLNTRFIELRNEKKFQLPGKFIQPLSNLFLTESSYRLKFCMPCQWTWIDRSQSWAFETISLVPCHFRSLKLPRMYWIKQCIVYFSLRFLLTRLF